MLRKILPCPRAQKGPTAFKRSSGQHLAKYYAIERGRIGIPGQNGSYIIDCECILAV